MIDSKKNILLNTVNYENNKIFFEGISLLYTSLRSNRGRLSFDIFHRARNRYQLELAEGQLSLL